MKRAIICVSSERTPTSSRILPILTKLILEMTAKETELVVIMKMKISDNLDKAYILESVRSFLPKVFVFDLKYKFLHSNNNAFGFVSGLNQISLYRQHMLY